MAMLRMDYSLPFHLHSLLLTIAWVFGEDQVKGPYDICERDVFNATCSSGQMIMMHAAMYGRMSLGTCIRQHVSNRDCDSDVLHILDGMCSGKQTCTVRPYNPIFLDVKRCPEYSAYLTASFRCIKVIANQQSCYQQRHVGSSNGYLSTVERALNGAGTKYCPWVLSSGQRYNITLYKFVPVKDSPLSSSSSVCFDIGTIKEAGTSHGILTCGGDPRNKVVYLSKGGDVQIHLKDDSFLKDLGTFALSFGATGCGEPEVGEHMSYRRQGDTVTVTCDHEEKHWQLKCINGQWVGSKESCSAGESTSVLTWIKMNTAYSLGLLALVTVGCAVIIFIGGFCLYVTYFYITRRNQPTTSVNQEYPVDIYKLQTMARQKSPSIPTYERTTSLYNSNSTLRKNTDYQRMNPIDPETASHHSYVLYDHVPKPLPPIPIEEKKHIYETPHAHNNS